MFNPTREQVRQFFCAVLNKLVQRLPLVGAELTASDIVARHPEYHGVLADPHAAVDMEWTPEGGQMNPFLHLSLHLAIAEQVAIDQPPGIRILHQGLCQQLGDLHAAEHAILECLGETIWRAQREGRALDTEAYLGCIRRVGGQA